MNAAAKTKLANILTAFVACLAIVQSLLISPPFPIDTVFKIGAVITYLTMFCTIWKQYLSPEVSATGTKVTIWIAVIATVAGVTDLLKPFSISGQLEQWIKWGITVIVAILNILSKQIFPSLQQKDKMNTLKFQQ